MKSSPENWWDVIERLPWEYIISQIVIILGILIGGWFGPWVTSRLSRRKEKNAVKAKLIETSSLYFANKKSCFFAHNVALTSVVKYNRAFDDLRNSKTDRETEVNRIRVSSLESLIATEKQKLEELRKTSIELRSKVYGLAVEVEALYGFDKYTRLRQSIVKYMKPVGEGLNYLNWLEMEYDEFTVKVKTLPTLHKEKKAEIENALDELTSDILTLLK